MGVCHQREREIAGPRFEEYEASARVDRRSETSFFLDNISLPFFNAASAAPASSDAVADRSVIIAKVFSSFLILFSSSSNFVCLFLLLVISF